MRKEENDGFVGEVRRKGGINIARQVAWQVAWQKHKLSSPSLIYTAAGTLCRAARTHRVSLVQHCVMISQFDPGGESEGKTRSSLRSRLCHLHRVCCEKLVQWAAIHASVHRASGDSNDTNIFS